MLIIITKERITIGKLIYPIGAYSGDKIIPEILLNAVIDAGRGARQFEIRGTQDELSETLKESIVLLERQIKDMPKDNPNRPGLMGYGNLWEAWVKEGKKDLVACPKCNALILKGVKSETLHNQASHSEIGIRTGVADSESFAFEQQKFTSLGG